MKIKTLNEYLLIEVFEKKDGKTKSGIIIPGEEGKKVEKAKVLNICEESIVKIGDIIYFKDYALEPVILEDKELHFVKQDAVLAVEV